MSTKKRKSTATAEPASSKSQLLLALKDQVIQLQQQLKTEQEEREKISGWLSNTLKPSLKTKFDDYRGELDTHTNQIDRIKQFLKDTRGSSSSSGSVSREEFEELQKNLAIEREARLQLSLWLKQSLGKNLELLDARIAAGSSGAPTSVVHTPRTTSVLPESVSEWLRMIGYERYIGEFQRAKCTDVKKLVKLTDDHLVKLGIALKRHRNDILHEVNGLKQKLDSSDATPLSTPVRGPPTPSRNDYSDTEIVDPFSTTDIEAKAAEQVEEKNRIIEAEKRRIQEQFDQEKREWMERERERIRSEVQQQEQEKIRAEEQKMSRKLAKERQALESKQREVEQKEIEAKKLLKKQEEEAKKLQDATRRKREDDDKYEQKERERKEKEDRARRELEEKARKEEKKREKERLEREEQEQANTAAIALEEEEKSSIKVSTPPVTKKKEESKPKTVVKKAETTEDVSGGKSFSQLIEDVRDDNCTTNWVAFYFDKASNSIKLTNFGSDGHEDLMNHLDDDKVQYAMLRVVDPKRRIKFIYIHWVGPKAHAFLKARSGTKKAEVLELMGQFHIEMPAETKDDISKQAILTKLKAAVNF